MHMMRYSLQYFFCPVRHGNMAALQRNPTLEALILCSTSARHYTALDDKPPKWVAAPRHVPGYSFGGPRQEAPPSAHQLRLNSIRRRRRQKTSKFSWKKEPSAGGGSSPLAVASPSPLSPPPKQPRAGPRRHQVPFNTSSPKSSWFDKFAVPPEEDDESLYHDKFHFVLRRMARDKKTSSLDRDRRSWNRANVYMNRSSDRGLAWKAPHYGASAGQLLSAAEDRHLFLARRPADSSVAAARRPLNMAGSAMRSTTRRMEFREPLCSGLAPPQQRVGPGAFVVGRPSFASPAFLASTRDARAKSNNRV